VLAWIDLEMTGLDPARHTIIEIACLVTDDDLVVTEEGPDLVVHATPEQLAEMDEHVRAMHTRSGLLAAVEESTLTLGDAGAETLAFLKKHIPQAQTVPLAGNSIGTDRRFLAALLPEVEDYLHYRSVDVSTVKELCRRWRPEVAKRAPQKKGGHRALADIRESVRELEYYRTSLFGGTPGAEGTAQSGETEPSGETKQSGQTEQSGETDGGPDTLGGTKETGGTEERV
jgi:oligoribonuclease